ncbi:thiolase family protein [Carboxydothermus hydrogenoformans]|uniref:Acetyl-CoA acetyltransferase n=1 Tax=Carboxydothermus hydrogenoformans (strain ATCC BAA-161 / DSM 6008 / Z-2901) TaxID=246194 RepID=Q3ABP8_CARHZ|nr:thiolase family protein [Carboxydothermus hydrogenoformans]ABB15363.1 acetyl-CoA acetyltransferase [Carboxydothermus hydrogenoformans Z-2901]
MREAVIVKALRTPVGKAPRGKLRNTRPEDLGALVIKEIINQTGINPEIIEDVIIGCAFPEAEQGMNLGRVVALRAGLPYSVPGVTVNRFCSSGLNAIADAAMKIMTGMSDVVIAGGIESMSMVPMGGNDLLPNPELMNVMPDAYLSMGLTAENVASRYNISREEQDEFAYKSHMKAKEAILGGKFKDEIVPVPVVEKIFDGKKVIEKTEMFEVDEGPRFDTTLEALARLKPVFRQGGTVTAGNSSQTSDGAAAALLMSAEKAEELGLKPIAVFRSFAVGGVEPEIMGIGPVVAIPKALKLAGITLDQVDVFELNEAFAAQALAVIKTLEIDPAKVNPNGGAIALGHPLGCTGAKLTATLLSEMQRRRAKYGVVSMCIGGGMGAAGVFELI